MSDEMVKHIYDDDDEYMYQKIGERRSDYEVRMKRVNAAIDARASDEEKRQAEELLKGADEAAKKLGLI